MRHPGETEYMPVDKTWGILDPSGIYTRHVVYVDSSISLNTLSSSWLLRLLVFTVRQRPQIDIEEYNFLERIFTKPKPEERTWAKLVNLNTVHWYCDGPEPTPAVIKYEEHTCQRKFVNLYVLLDCLYCKLTHLLFRDGRLKKKGSYKTSGRKEKRDGRGCYGNGFK